MKNQVIKVLDAEHGKKVIEYFKNKGAYGNSLTGCNVGFYYGITDGGNKIWQHTAEDIINTDVEIIALPKEEPPFNPKCGDKVLVSDGGKEWRKSIFLTEIKGARYPIIAVCQDSEEEFNKSEIFETVFWKYMIPIPEKTKVTMQEIADWKGVKVEDLIIE